MNRLKIFQILLLYFCIAKVWTLHQARFIFNYIILVSRKWNILQLLKIKKSNFFRNCWGQLSSENEQHHRSRRLSFRQVDWILFSVSSASCRNMHACLDFFRLPVLHRCPCVCIRVWRIQVTNLTYFIGSLCHFDYLAALLFFPYTFSPNTHSLMSPRMTSGPCVHSPGLCSPFIRTVFYQCF